MSTTIGRRVVTTVLLVPVTAVLVSCSGSSLTPLPDPVGLTCDDAYLLGSDLERPDRIEVWNETDSELRLSLDNCRTLGHLGWVRPGAKIAFSLPEALTYFPEGLRFQVYHKDPPEHFGTFHVDPSGIVARLVISDPSRARSGSR